MIDKSAFFSGRCYHARGLLLLQVEFSKSLLGVCVGTQSQLQPVGEGDRNGRRRHLKTKLRTTEIKAEKYMGQSKHQQNASYRCKD